MMVLGKTGKTERSRDTRLLDEFVINGEEFEFFSGVMITGFKLYSMKLMSHTVQSKKNY